MQSLLRVGCQAHVLLHHLTSCRVISKPFTPPQGTALGHSQQPHISDTLYSYAPAYLSLITRTLLTRDRIHMILLRRTKAADGAHHDSVLRFQCQRLGGLRRMQPM